MSSENIPEAVVVSDENITKAETVIYSRNNYQETEVVVPIKADVARSLENRSGNEAVSSGNCEGAENAKIQTTEKDNYSLEQDQDTNRNNENAFISHTHRDKCIFSGKYRQLSSEIEKSVKRILTRIFESVGNMDQAFEVSDIIEAGSFYEGTKNGRPDEFDFMVVMKHLSLPENITITDGCIPWYKKIIVSDHTEMYANFLDLSFKNVKKLSVKHLSAKFWSLVERNCFSQNAQEFPISDHMQFGTISVKNCKSRKLTLQFIEVNRSVNLCSDVINETSCKTLVALHEMEIGVDLMIAIKYPNVNDIVKSDGFPSKYSYLLEEFGCHLVSKSCQNSLNECSTCWHITHTRAELELMKGIDDKHKVIYKVMKHLLTREVYKIYRNKCANFSSFMLKNAFLFHVYEIKKCKESKSGCYRMILKYLADFRKQKMPCFFARNLDCWGPVFKFPFFRYPNSDEDIVWRNDNARNKWYAVLWLELWRRYLIHSGKLLKEITRDNYFTSEGKFKLLRESMVHLIVKYCSESLIIQTPNSFIPISLPIEFNEEDLTKRFDWFCGLLSTNFGVKFDDLLPYS